ncbi:biopolymer transporter ExbD [bacterium]|nr:MAG: biopolymer transporter ExbD [bacterium]
MSEIGAAQPRSHGKGKKRKRRLGVRLDMTPMVDVAFLLLTFFMLTTAFRLPQTMEISIPEDDKESNQVKIAESNILQVRVTDDNTIYWNLGNNAPQKTDLNNLRHLFIERSEKNIQDGKGVTIKEKYKLIMLIKIDKKAKYEHMINIVDELDLAMVSLNEKNKLTESGSKLSPRFAFAPLTDRDLTELKKAP